MKVIKKIIIFCAIGAAVFYGYKAINSNSSTEEKKPMINESTEIEYTVNKGFILNSVSGNASVNPSDKRTIKSEADGTVENFSFTEGDIVQKNQILMSIKSDISENKAEEQNINEKIEEIKNQLNDLYNSQGELNVYANASGVLKNLNVKSGDDIAKNQNLGTIEDTDYVYAQSYFYKSEIDKIKVGDKASVFISDFLSAYDGEIVSVNYLPAQFGGGVFGYEVTAKLKNLGGMSEGNITQITVKKDDGDIESFRAGNIQKNKTENITSHMDGKIKDLKVKTGQRINKGDLLFTLTSDHIDEQIKKLEKEISKYNDKLKTIYKDNNIYSPISGTILSVGVSNNDVIDRSTALITIANLDTMEAVLNVDELDILKLNVGQEATITSDVFEDEFFTGKITNISLEGNNQNGTTTYKVTISIDDRKNLMSGMNVNVNIISENKQNILTVPIEAVIKSIDGYIVRVKKSDGTVSDVPVEIGSKDKYNVEIISGLNEGDIILYTAATMNGQGSGNGFMMISPSITME